MNRAGAICSDGNDAHLFQPITNYRTLEFDKPLDADGLEHRRALGRRFGMRVSLDPFGWNTPERQIEFRMFLNYFDEKLPF